MPKKKVQIKIQARAQIARSTRVASELVDCTWSTDVATGRDSLFYVMIHTHRLTATSSDDDARQVLALGTWDLVANSYCNSLSGSAVRSGWRLGKDSSDEWKILWWVVQMDRLIGFWWEGNPFWSREWIFSPSREKCWGNLNLNLMISKGPSNKGGIRI